MISYHYETNFELDNETLFSHWISAIVLSEHKIEGDLNFIFCDDEFLHKLNLEYLQHDTLTDILSFDYCVGKELHGDIFISVERVRENALEFDVLFDNELKRVMAHGILHYCGYKDKNEEEILLMRNKENEMILLF